MSRLTPNAAVVANADALPWQGGLSVLGATGSIGISTLDVCSRLGVPIHALSANSKVAELAALARQHKPKVVVIADEAKYAELKRAELGGAEPRAGAAALDEISTAPGCGAVMTAIVGAAGMPATLAAVRAGKRVCIANKEPLVMAGALIMAEAARYGARIVPVDSEHSALFQCLEGREPHEVAKLTLTASGGPLRTVTDLSSVTREQALKHPTWSMGPKITIDSATLMNKALELIEAHILFGVGLEQLEVLIHPQSIIHSMVSFRDGSVLAQLGLPDMCTPIQYALTWPRHRQGPVAPVDLATVGRLDFHAVDHARFPSITLGRQAAKAGGVAPAVMNAANEVAVQAFLDGMIAFTRIFALVERALAAIAPGPAVAKLEAVLAADADARALVRRDLGQP